ncbi:MAG: hypothetical protein DYG89_37525 [Caldilinea sp. CFX5]|nr:hypothetical protein [Caldilinea sp. CFX5]
MLISSALVLFAAFTTLFAQQAGADAPDKPMSVTTHHVFMPLVQSDPEIARKEADDRLGDMATVASVVVSTTAVFPVQINALVRGSLPTACMEIAKIQQRQAGDQIWLTIATRSRLDRRLCAAELTPFAETVALDLTGLAAGQYTVVVQGVQASFTLTADNLAPHQLYLPLGSHR